MAEPDPKVGSRCEFKTYQEVYKKDGRLTMETLPEPFTKMQISDDDNPYALVIRRTYTEKNELKSVILQINSPHLLKSFRDVVKSYTTVPSDFTSQFELTSPFQMLMHYWDELDLYRKQTDDTTVRMHLNLLFEFMHYEIGPAREKISAMLQKGQITYHDAWTIFRPGDLLFTQEMGHSRLLRCHKTVYEESSQRGPYLEVHCTYTDHDGTLVGQGDHKTIIFQKLSFGQENPAFITDLPIYPRKFVKGQDDLEERLEKRGREFLKLIGISIQAYDGIAQYLKEPPDSYYNNEMAEFDGVWLLYMETGRVILDRKTFQEDMYSDQIKIRVTEPEPLLCPPYAQGYSINRKEWGRFLIENMSEVQWKADVWNSLVVDDEIKSVLQALVTSHRYTDNSRNQPEQKGKGLVILFHGKPGSGKTLSAETAAEGTHKALLSTSVGQLNKYNDPWILERNLKRLLQYATTWKAVVLLDEVDVFLEARDERGGSFERNSLVAIFLRELEYFSGIVFLTTNRLASFDLAIKSRIHLSLGFGSLGVDTRRQIWINCLKNIPADETELDDVDDAVDNVIQQQLNGREIANAVNTARTIARFKGKKLQLQHIESVLEVRDGFEKTLQRERRAMTAEIGSSGLLRTNSILLAEHEKETI